MVTCAIPATRSWRPDATWPRTERRRTCAGPSSRTTAVTTTWTRSSRMRRPCVATPTTSTPITGGVSTTEPTPVTSCSRKVAPQQRLHPTQQLLQSERLRQVVVSARLQTQHPVGHRIPGRQHQNQRQVPASKRLPRSAPIRTISAAVARAASPTADPFRRLDPRRGHPRPALAFDLISAPIPLTLT